MNWVAFTGTLGAFCLIWGVVDGINWVSWKRPDLHRDQQYRFMTMLCLGALLLATCAGIN